MQIAINDMVGVKGEFGGIRYWQVLAMRDIDKIPHAVVQECEGARRVKTISVHSDMLRNAEIVRTPEHPEHKVAG